MRAQGNAQAKVTAFAGEAPNRTETMDLFAGHLAMLPIFQGLKPGQIAAIARRAERVAFPPGAVIIKEGAVADAAVLIVSGEASRISGPGLYGHPEPVPPGSLLGETGMLVETTHGSTVVARTRLRAVQLRRETMHALMLEDPDLIARVTANIGRQLAGMAAQLRKVDMLLRRSAGRPAPPAALAG